MPEANVVFSSAQAAALASKPSFSGRTVTARYDVGRAVSCLAAVHTPPDSWAPSGLGQLLAVGGRNTLKLLRVSRSGLADAGFPALSPNTPSGLAAGGARSAAAASTSFEICDMDFAPVSPGSDKTSLAAATKNGILAIWDTDRNSAKMSRRIEAHKRTINRVKWHPIEHHMVATASQDGTLKIWDRRARSRPSSAGSEAAAVTIAPAAGAIRDVTFCYDDHRAAVALEAGVVAVYDKRFADTSLARWVGHGADVHCVQWHPTFPNMLASAAAAPDYTVKIWDLNHTQPVGQAKPLYTISPAGNVHRLRWRPGAPVGLPTPASASAAEETAAGGGSSASGAIRDARARSEESVDSSGDYDDDDEGESPHVWQLATECHHRGSVIQVWDVREPVMPIAVVHPPAPSFFSDATDVVNSTTSGSNNSNSSISSSVASENATSLRTPRRQEAVEYVGFEWLDTPSPRVLLPEPSVESPKKPDAEVATPWTLFSSLAAKPAAAAAPADATSPFFSRHKLRHAASSISSTPRGNSLKNSGRADSKDALDDDVYLGLWQHFITTVKVGTSGALLVNSCGGAIQPPSEVAPVAMALSPKGILATVHQEQPIAHRAIPSFQLASTRIDYGNDEPRHAHPPLGIFHVQPQNVNAASVFNSSALSNASASASALGTTAGLCSKEKSKPVLCLEALHHKLRHAPLHTSLLSQSPRSTASGPDITAPWFGGNSSSSSNNRLAVRKGARGDAWSSSYGDAFAGLLRSPETATVANRRCIEVAPCEGAIPNQLAWTKSDLATWEVSEKRRDILRAEAGGGGDGAPLPDGALAVNAAELAARVLGHGSALAMQLLLDHNPACLSSEDLLTLGRVFIGRRVLFAHRTSDVVWTVGGIDSRPASTIYFGKDGASSSSANDQSQSSKQQKKKKKQRQDEKKVCIADYLTTHVKYAFYFVQHPLKFAATLPCFNMANKDGRLDSFPMETCLIVLDPRYDPIATHFSSVSSLSSSLSPSFPSFTGGTEGGATISSSDGAIASLATGIAPQFSTTASALAMAGVGDDTNDNGEDFIEGDGGVSSSSLAGAVMREPHLVQRLAHVYKLWPDSSVFVGNDNSNGDNDIGVSRNDSQSNSRVSQASEYDIAAALCHHNGRMTKELGAEHLALAWEMLATFLAPSGNLLIDAAGSDGEIEEEDRDSVEEDTDDGDNNDFVENEEEDEEDEVQVDGNRDDDDDVVEEKKEKEGDANQSTFGIGKGPGQGLFREPQHKTSNLQIPSSLRTSRNHSAGSLSHSRHSLSGGSIGTVTTFAISKDHVEDTVIDHATTSAASGADGDGDGRRKGVASKLAALSLGVPPAAASNQVTEVVSNLEPIELPWLFQETVRDLLAERSAMGDVQTCVAITEVLKTVTQPVVVAAASASAGATNTNSASSGVLGAVDGPAAAAADANNDAGSGGNGNSSSGNGGDAGNDSSSSIQRLVDAVSSPGQRREWGWWYIEQLRSLQEPVAANEVCARSDDEFLAKLNTNSTTVYASCGKCKKPVVGGKDAAWCSKCRSALTQCVLCHQPVRGLYAICPGCGHGGHLNHLERWFGFQTTCPSGCGHACNFAQLQLSPSAQLASNNKSSALLLSHLSKV